MPDNDKYILDELFSTVETLFVEINTEYKLERLLIDNNLINKFVECDVSPDNDSEVETEDEASQNEDYASENEDDAQNDETEGAAREGDDASSDVDDAGDIFNYANTNVSKPITSMLMPIAFQLKSFLELPDIFSQILTNTANIQRQPKLNHFINGKLWKEKLKNFTNNEIVIPYHFYVDGAQLNNPLGPHISKGEENFNYIILPTIPAEYQSRLHNIFVTSLFHGMLIIFASKN